MIVPFYNVEKYLAACLDSILEQTTGDYEVILVDDGSPDGSRAIAESYVARDPRFRLVIRENGGLGAARNTGIQHARGRFLTFVDSDDLLPPNALAALRASARRTGSDIVVGAVERFDSFRQWSPNWVPELHTVRRDRIRIESFLPLLRNLYTWNKLYRRDFWESQGLWFREGVSYEDQPIVTQLLLRARGIDVIPDVVYHYRMRDDQSSISQQTATVKDLRDRVSAWRATEEALTDAPENVHRAWLQTLFDAHFLWYLTSAGTEDDDYWELIRSVVVDLTAHAPQSVWDAAPPASRVLLELARQGRRADVQAFVDAGGARDQRGAESEPQADGVLLKLPGYGDADLDPSLFLLRPDQLRVAHLVSSASWAGDELTLRGRAHLRNVDLRGRASHVDLVVRDARTGAEQVYAARDGVDLDCPMPFEDDWCDYRPATFEVTAPFGAASAALNDRSGRWELLLRVSAAGFRVDQPVTRLMRAGAAGGLEATWLEDGSRLFLTWRHPEPAHVVREPAALRATELRIDGRRVSGSLVGPLAVGLRALDLVWGRTVVGVRLDRAGAALRFEVTVPPASGRRTATWELRAQAATGPVPVELSDLAGVAAPPAAALQLTRNAAGHARVVDRAPGAEGLEVRVTEDGGLRIVGQVFGEGIHAVQLGTRWVRSTSTGPRAHVVDGRFLAELDLRHDVHRFGRLPLGIGEHLVDVRLVGEGDEPLATVPLTISPELNSQLPVPVATKVHQGRVVRGANGALQVTLGRPVGAEMTRAAQYDRQRALMATRGRASTRGLLLRAYFGERATDNGVAIQAELRRRGSDLPVFWAVQDHGVPVPEGGIPVVVNSAQWFDLLGSVTYYVDNMYQPEYHLKPEGQVLVQTFHGYPFKLMGHPHWRQQGFPRAKIAAYEWRTAEWDYLVSPATYATPLLTRDFGYDGAVLEIGYPRNDVLQSPEAGPLREVVRESLGIRPDQTAILYAPTFRDYLAQNDNRALMSDFLDFEAIGRAFGDDVVVLMRGHAFHARTKHRIGHGASLINVTDYPEVNDLYLAADVGIVDYSSLRFDFGVTGKPMIFLVPDLERYVETRGWLFDFGPTAPGPQVRTTDEVIEQLRDLPALVAKYADEYDAFRSSYLSLEDGHAAARFVDAVMVPRGDA